MIDDTSFLYAIRLVGISMLLAATPAPGQVARDFGSPMPRAAPVTFTTTGRTCLMKSPLLGPRDHHKATPADWARTRAMYPKWESELKYNIDVSSIDKSWISRNFANDHDLLRGRPSIGSATRSKSDSFIEEQKKEYFEIRREGASASYMYRFAALMELVGLLKEGREKEASSLANLIVSRDRLFARFKKLDEYEDATYFTPQSVDNFIILISHVATRAVAVSYEKKLKADLSYLDDRDALLPIIAKFNYASSDAEILGDIGRAAVRGELGDGLVAAWYDQGHGYATVRNRRVHTLDISFRGGGTPPPPPIMPLAASPDFDGASGGFGRYGGASIVSVVTMTPMAAEQAYRRKVANVLARHSTTDGILYDVQVTAGGSAVLHLPRGELAKVGVGKTGDSIRLSSSDLKIMRSGEALPPSHALTLVQNKLNGRALVQYTNPFQTYSSKSKEAARAVSFAMQKGSSARIYRDPLSEATMVKAKRLNDLQLGSANEYVALIADAQFGVDDRGTINNVKSELEAAGVRIVQISQATPPPSDISESNVIIIAAHSAPELSKFVRWLGEGGVLSGKRVLFESCGTELTAALSEAMVQQYGAEAVFTHQGTIDARKVQDALAALAIEISKSKNGSMVDEIHKIMRSNNISGIWTISRRRSDMDGKENYA